MTKFKTINGWTKAKMRAVVEARPFDEAARNGISCVYLAPNGNKCAAGLFLPDGHPAQKSLNTVETILYTYPDLQDKMPLDVAGMGAFQSAHDREASAVADPLFKGNAKAAMLAFIDERVED